FYCVRVLSQAPNQQVFQFTLLKICRTSKKGFKPPPRCRLGGIIETCNSKASEKSKAQTVCTKIRQTD
ncbi:hypothetical protein QWY20_17675, partial [Alkalimonas sp. MEB108]